MRHSKLILVGSTCLLAFAAFAAKKFHKFAPIHFGYITVGPPYGSGKCTVPCGVLTTVNNPNKGGVARQNLKVCRTNTIGSNQKCGQTLYTLPE
jgi:hypothetical protein